MKSTVKSFGVAICLIAIMAVFPGCDDPASPGGTLIIINPDAPTGSQPAGNYTLTLDFNGAQQFSGILSPGESRTFNSSLTDFLEDNKIVP